MFASYATLGRQSHQSLFVFVDSLCPRNESYTCDTHAFRGLAVSMKLSVQFDSYLQRPCPSAGAGAYRKLQIKVILILPAKKTVRVNFNAGVLVYSRVSRQRYCKLKHSYFKPMCFVKWLCEARAI